MSAAAPGTKRRILFVDDDPQFLQMIDRVMRLWSKDNLEIVTAQSASAAMAILQDQSLDLVVMDVCMPVVDGLQFLAILNRRHPGLQKVVLTGYATDAYRTACLSNGAELFLEKPRTSEGMESVFATLDELTRWKPEPGFRGVLRRVGLLDVIQMECLGKSSSLLVVTAPKASGRIYIKEGAIVHAEIGDIKGEQALNRLLTLSTGDFRLNAFAEPAEQTITGAWEGLLMDAAQARDEAAGAAGQATEPADDNLGGESGAGSSDTEHTTTAPTAPLTVEELMICSEAGDVYHSWQCANTDLRINFLEFLSQKARLLHNVLPLGLFDRAEFCSDDARLLAQIGTGRGVFLRTSTAPTEPKAVVDKARTNALATPERKGEAQRWFQDHLEMAGLLAATLQFSDRSGCSHSVSPKFAADALDSLRRCVGDGFQVLRLQRFTANRARWVYDQTAIECAQWSDGTAIAFVLSRQALDLNSEIVAQRIAEFLAQEGSSN